MIGNMQTGQYNLSLFFWFSKTVSEIMHEVHAKAWRVLDQDMCISCMSVNVSFVCTRLRRCYCCCCCCCSSRSSPRQDAKPPLFSMQKVVASRPHSSLNDDGQATAVYIAISIYTHWTRACACACPCERTPPPRPACTAHTDTVQILGCHVSEVAFGSALATSDPPQQFGLGLPRSNWNMANCVMKRNPGTTERLPDTGSPELWFLCV